MKLWKDMNDYERNSLMAAHKVGKTIQFFINNPYRDWIDCVGEPAWCNPYAYRVKPETKEETMKLWKDLTACEKGALLLAYHEKKVIEYRSTWDHNWYSATKGGGLALGWHDDNYYRVMPEPVVIEVVRYGQVCDGVEPWGGGFALFTTQGRKDTHKITFNMVDGVPDCNSIKMIKL